jgi:hypothetical protein
MARLFPGWGSELSPSFHQLAPLLEEITTTICRVHFVLDRMSQRRLEDLAWEVGLRSGPIPK